MCKNILISALFLAPITASSTEACIPSIPQHHENESISQCLEICVAEQANVLSPPEPGFGFRDRIGCPSDVRFRNEGWRQETGYRFASATVELSAKSDGQIHCGGVNADRTEVIAAAYCNGEETKYHFESTRQKILTSEQVATSYDNCIPVCRPH